MSTLFNREKELGEQGKIYETYGLFGGAPYSEIEMLKQPITPRENLNRYYAGGDYEWIPDTYSDVVDFTPSIDPDNIACGYEGGIDSFGVEWEALETGMPAMVRPGNPLLKDIEDWRELKVEDVDSWDWEGCAKHYEVFDHARYFRGGLPSGLFERMIALMDFENAAVALLMGRVLIEDAYRPFRDSDYPLIEWLGGYLQNMIVWTGKFYFGISKEFELMMRALLLKQASWKKEYGTILNQHGWNTEDTYQCLHICAPADAIQSMDINNGAFYLRDFFDSHYVLVHKESIYQIINISKTQYSADERYKRLEQFLDNNHFAAGVSIEFGDFTRVGFYLQQASLAVSCARQSSGGFIVDFEKDVFRLMLKNLKGSYSSEFYCTNAVLRLLQYDRENHADLTLTLKCYLENNLNATKTQEMLHIARTTCLYRVQRIERIMNVDLKDIKVQLYLLILFQMIQIT